MVEIRMQKSVFRVEHTLFYTSIIGATVLKMVGLEKLSFGSFPLEIRVASILLPLAMVYGRVGIAAMTLGCASAHLVGQAPASEVGAAAFSAFLGSYLAYMLVKAHFSTRRILAGCLLITFVWSVVMGTQWAITSGYPVSFTFALMLSRMFFSVNLFGFGLAIGIKRFGGRTSPL